MILEFFFIYILYVFHSFFFTEHCGFKSLNTRKVILSFLYFVLLRIGRRKSSNFFSQNIRNDSQSCHGEKMTKIILYDISLFC